MRTLAILVLAASPAAGQGIILTISGNTSPTLHRLNATTGVQIDSCPITGHQAIYGGMAFTGAGLAVIDGEPGGNPDRILTINNFTGVATAGPTISNQWTRHSLIFQGSCSCTNAYYSVIGDNTLYRVDRITGQATTIAPLSGSPRLDQVTAFGLSYSNQAYITDTTDTDLFLLNLNTGQVTWIGSIGESANPFLDLAGHYAGLFGVRANGGIYSISLTTAVQTFVHPGSYTAIEWFPNGSPFCYANCDQSTTNPVLTPNDFQCFIDKFVSGSSYANCDGTTGTPNLTPSDFQCFLDQYAGGCP